jgi:hypothetical protein
MSEHNHIASTTGTFLTFLFFILSKVTLADVALVMTIITALTTVGLNIQKFIQNRKLKNKDL